jgi:hypothetical protein
VNINNSKNAKLILKTAKSCGMLSQWLITNMLNGKELSGNVLMLILYSKKTKFSNFNLKILKKLEVSEVTPLL